jgi:hypothetical protein
MMKEMECCFVLKIASRKPGRPTSSHGSYITTSLARNITRPQTPATRLAGTITGAENTNLHCNSTVLLFGPNADANNCSRREFKAAMSVYNESPEFFKNEIARTSFKMGAVYQDMGNLVTGRRLIDEAQKLRKDLIPPEQWRKAENESDFDELVQFWTR